jgi:hypothetical protein
MQNLRKCIYKKYRQGYSFGIYKKIVSSLHYAGYCRNRSNNAWALNKKV